MSNHPHDPAGSSDDGHVKMNLQDAIDSRYARQVKRYRHLADESFVAYAAQLGDLDVVKAIYPRRRIPCIVSRPPIDESALSNALAAGHVDVARYLIKCKAPISGHALANAAIEACSLGYLDVMQFIGSTFRMPDVNWTQCLHVAAVNGHGVLARYLINLGVEVNSQLLVDSDLEVIKLLGDRGCRFDSSILTEAAHAGRADIIDYVIGLGLPIPPSAMEIASANNQFHVVEYLLERGAPAGNTISIIYCKYDTKRIIERLIHSPEGLDVTLVTK